MTTSETPQKKWFPLESNPTLLNKYVTKLGFNTSNYSFVDVYSTESWALEMIPLPVLAVIMLYPLTEAQERHREEEEKELSQQQGNNAETNERVWHIKQRIGNACGTIGVLHALANIPKETREITISQSSWMSNFLSRCPSDLSSLKKAEILESDVEIETMHEAATTDAAAQTSRGQLDDKLDTHFVAFVRGSDGGLYELDGRKSGPVRHGATTGMTLLGDACRVIEGFMKRDPGELRFTIAALAPTIED